MGELLMEHLLEGIIVRKLSFCVIVWRYNNIIMLMLDHLDFELPYYCHLLGQHRRANMTEVRLCPHYCLDKSFLAILGPNLRGLPISCCHYGNISGDNCD